jgi:hypothetical protein
MGIDLMPVLHLGVTDLPYVQSPSRRQRKTNASTVTTGDVAGWLENRYHVMEVFSQEHMPDIAGDLENSLQGSLESLLLGAPPSLDPFGGATSKIEDRFRQFLSLGEMEKLGYPGVPTKASLKGVNNRMKNNQGTPGRPSFRDTGLYEASFQAWVD